jgi:cytochrome P450
MNSTRTRARSKLVTSVSHPVIARCERFVRAMAAVHKSNTTTKRQPPGPPGLLLLGHARELQVRALDFFLEIARDYGDVAAIRMLNRTGYVVSHPDGIRQILQRNHIYPPTFALARRAVAADTICGYAVPADAVVWTNICAVHRHPAYWSRPEAFNPDRFSAGGADVGVRDAYFPFGGGPHLCIGNAFALTEAQLLLAMIVQRYRLRAPSAQPVQPVVELTVRPRGGVPMLALPR